MKLTELEKKKLATFNVLVYTLKNSPVSTGVINLLLTCGFSKEELVNDLYIDEDTVNNVIGTTDLLNQFASVMCSYDGGDQ